MAPSSLGLVDVGCDEGDYCGWAVAAVVTEIDRATFEDIGGSESTLV